MRSPRYAGLVATGAVVGLFIGASVYLFFIGIAIEPLFLHGETLKADGLLLVFGPIDAEQLVPAYRFIWEARPASLLAIGAESTAFVAVYALFWRRHVGLKMLVYLPFLAYLAGIVTAAILVHCFGAATWMLTP